MMKTILVFGAGKSSTILIDYLIALSPENNWSVIIADADKEHILSKTNNSPYARAIEIDIQNEIERAAWIQLADIVISLMPPHLHFLIAKDCVQFNKNLLTASYADDQLKALESEIKKKGLLFICELGLDPGIDHMSAMQRIDDIKASGGEITSFKSHCGGLVAPESDNNPWRYKISWNPRNIVMAGKAGAIYKMNGVIVKEQYEQLFAKTRSIEFPKLGSLSFYPNRNSLEYIELYKLEEATTFMRTTLRYAEFMKGWNELIQLKLTDETKAYETDGLSIKEFFVQHFIKHHLTHPPSEQLLYLGLEDDKTLINKGFCSAADILQFILETKLMLLPSDKDMIAMMHEIDYEKEGKSYKLQSSLIVKGEDNIRTAMAKTVGLPLGIAVKLILNNRITITGLHIPVIKEIYDPILAELKNHGIEFTDQVK
jgi:saccharopine dehydrogenase-like NADP-dependent oxidoreductase